MIEIKYKDGMFLAKGTFSIGLQAYMKIKTLATETSRLI